MSLNADLPSSFEAEPPMKKQKITHDDDDADDSSDSSLPVLCSLSKWDQAQLRAETHPHEATWTNRAQKGRRPSGSISSTPLALACRKGAPIECIRAILQACPSQLRRLIGSFGTPLHEAIVCNDIQPGVIEMLLKKDEELGGPLESRAALLQDVDGHTPLHLLIRRRFQFATSSNNKRDGMQMLKALVESCPEAMDLSDCGEYEEPPLVMALKASLYFHPPSEDEDYQGMEQYVHEVISIMLSAYPRAASRVLSGSRGQYTPLHSAVFHGRCSDIMKLLLDASQEKEACLLLSNTQGELPLHFCAMRGEPPPSIELLSAAAPTAVLKRDASGQTPMHWLWIRFVSTLLSLEETARNNEASMTNVHVATSLSSEISKESRRYLEWSQLKRGDYYSDLKLIRKLDPPVDFLRMRHIPPQLLAGQGADWADRTATVLQRIRNQYYSYTKQARRQGGREDTSGNESMAVAVACAKSAGEDNDDDGILRWTRREAVTALFWTKLVALLRAAASATQQQEQQKSRSSFYLSHTAMSTFACPPSMTRIITTLFPEELRIVDSEGKLPLHHAASRPGWNNANVARENQGTVPPFVKEEESLEVLKRAMSVSPPEAARVSDRNNRLPLHHAIDTFVKACSRPSSYYYWYSAASAERGDEASRTSSSSSSSPVETMLHVLKDLVKLYPDSLERRDGKTKLYPFLQATAAATEYKSPPSPNGYPVLSDEMPLSIVYLLLRENPSLVKEQKITL